MNARMWMAHLGGARVDILRQTPNDAPRHTAMGGVLVSTALVAAASAAFALHNTLDTPVWGAVLIGLAWGAVILNLDRMLVLSMDVRGSLRRNIATAVPRVLLAILIGAVISTPLVLAIFDKEITSEISRMQAEERLASQESRAQEFSDIPGLQAEVDRLDGIANRGDLPTVDDDPQVVEAQQNVDAKNKTYQAASAAAACEFNGANCPGGTGVPGRGAEYDRKKAEADAAQQELDRARQNLTRVRNDAEGRIAQSAPAAREQARVELQEKQAELDQRLALRSQVTAEGTDAAQNNEGLLAQLKALERVSGSDPMMLLAHLTLFLLFMAIEVLPVFVKILSGLGKPTLYDTLLDRRETECDDDDKVWADQERTITTERARVRLELEKDRVDQQIRAGKQATTLLVDEQRRITEDAIRLWAQVAAARSNAELDRWYRQHAEAPRPPTGPTPAGPTRPAPAQDNAPTAAPAHVTPQPPTARTAPPSGPPTVPLLPVGPLTGPSAIVSFSTGPSTPPAQNGSGPTASF